MRVKSKNMRVKPKIDLWVSIVLWIPVPIIALCIFAVPQNERVIGYTVGPLLLLLIIWVFFGTYYELRESYLYCRVGPFFEKIAYEKIKSVRPIQSIPCSMALSSRCIEIRQHGKGYITGTTLISPKNREEFMKELVDRCNNLEQFNA